MGNPSLMEKLPELIELDQKDSLRQAFQELYETLEDEHLGLGKRFLNKHLDQFPELTHILLAVKI